MKIFELLNENDVVDPDRDSVEKRLADLVKREKEIDTLLKDITPGFNPISPDEGDDQLVGYTTPRKSREILKNPELYQYGKTIEKEKDFQRPLFNKNTKPPDNWKKKGMPLPNDEYPTKNIDI